MGDRVMFDDFVRLGLLTLVGAALVLVTAGYLGFLVQELSSRGEIVIEPFTVVSENGEKDGERGKALAQALQARLQSLVIELRSSEDELKARQTDAPASGTGAVYRSPLGATGAKVSAVSERLDALKTGLLQPLDFKVSVAGLEVSGMVPWLQRFMVSRRTVHFAVFTQKDATAHKNVTRIFGSVGAFGLTRQGLQLDVLEDDDKLELSPAKVADRLAHEIVRRYLVQETTAALDLLSAEDFSELSDILEAAARAKRHALFVNNPSAFGLIAPRIFALADKTSGWMELTYFAGWIADNAGDTANALTYYQHAQVQFQRGRSAETAAQIARRIAELAPPIAPSADQLPKTVDISHAVFIRDGGSEGSVVGQTLATTMDLQIAKATGETRRMSARYIYYAARKAEGTSSIDAGANIKDGIEVLSKQGAVEESVWPYVAGEFAKPPPANLDRAPRFKIADARKVSSLEEIRRTLAAGDPVVATIFVFPSFMNLDTTKRGIVPLPEKPEQMVGGHAIVLVGYNDETKLLKFANSWGTRWGDHGFGLIPYDYVSNPKLAGEAWTFRFADTPPK